MANLDQETLMFEVTELRKRLGVIGAVLLTDDGNGHVHVSGDIAESERLQIMSQVIVQIMNQMFGGPLEPMRTGGEIVDDSKGEDKP